MREEWREVAGYEGLYEVSNLGNIRALDRTVKGNSKRGTQNISGHAKKKSIAKTGYEVVLLHKDGSYKTKTIHRLVAKAFIPNPDNRPIVNHLDGNKRNNRVTNLEWCTQKRNVQHAYEIGLVSIEKPVRCVETGKIYKSETAVSVEIYGDRRAQSFIGEACRGEKPTAYGYHWEFAEKEAHNK